MKMLKAVLLALMVSVAAGCATGPFATAPIPVDKALSPAAQKAQNVINEANVTLTAAALVIARNKKEGISTRAQAQADLNKVKKAGEDLDKVQILLDAGSVADAQARAEALNTLLLSLHKEVTSRKAKP